MIKKEMKKGNMRKRIKDTPLKEKTITICMAIIQYSYFILFSKIYIYEPHFIY